MLPLVSVAIVNYNGEKVIVDCLSSILKSEYPSFEVILVDNGSTDKSLESVRKSFPDEKRFSLIECYKNLGPAEGRNRAIQSSKGQYVVLLHNDTVVNPRWIGHLVTVMESDHTIGAAQCKILLYDFPDRFDSAGVKMDAHGCPISIGKVTGFLAAPSSNAFDVSTCELDTGQHDKSREIFATTFCATAARKSVLSSVGSFDPEFFGSLEDVDLSWRIRLAGYKIVCAPKAIVYHRGGATSTKKEFLYGATRAFSRNRLAMLIKNYSMGSLLALAPSIIGWYLSVASFCLLLDRRLFLEHCIGAAQNLSNLRNTLRKRGEVQRSRKVSDRLVSEHMSVGCITVDYKLRPWIRSRRRKSSTSLPVRSLHLIMPIQEWAERQYRLQGRALSGRR